MKKQIKNRKPMGGCLLTGNKARFFHAILMIVMSVLLCIAGLFSFNFNKLKSDAYTPSTMPASIGSLTFTDYDTRTDGQVFDPVVKIGRAHV